MFNHSHITNLHAREPGFSHIHATGWHAREPVFSHRSGNWLTCKGASVQSQLVQLTDIQESQCSVTVMQLTDMQGSQDSVRGVGSWLTFKKSRVQSQGPTHRSLVTVTSGFLGTRFKSQPQDWLWWLRLLSWNVATLPRPLQSVFHC